MRITGIEDFELDGQGGEVVLRWTPGARDLSSVINVADSGTVRLRNLSVGYWPRPFTQGRVVVWPPPS